LRRVRIGTGRGSPITAERIMMLPDFPNVRKQASAILERWFHKRVSQRTGVLQQMRARPLHEGDKLEFHRLDGSVDHVPMKRVGSRLELRLDDFQEKGLQAVLESLDKTAAHLAQKRSEFFFKRLEQVCDESGQTLDVLPQMELDIPRLIELLNTVDIDFDDKGRPLLPTLISSPAVRESFEKADITDAQRKRFEQVIEEKRAAWRDRESNRRLVD
jgi:hypothetical protein